MRKFILEKSDNYILTPHSGLALVGACVNNYTNLAAALGRIGKGKAIISDFDVLMSYTGLPLFHGDPADRLIVATAMENKATLMTADQKILSWNQFHQKIDARL